MNAQTSEKTTGITGADKFVARARQLGLTVEVQAVDSEAAFHADGSVMLPSVLGVVVTVSIPVPSELNDTVLGLVERHTTLTSCWSKRDTTRSRGRWVSANYSTLGGHEDLHVMRRLDSYLNVMVTDMQNLNKLVKN